MLQPDPHTPDHPQAAGAAHDAARAAQPRTPVSAYGPVLGLPVLYTADEVATALRTTRKCIYELARTHRIPGVVKLGRKLLFRRDRLVQWLRESSVPSLEE